MPDSGRLSKIPLFSALAESEIVALDRRCAWQRYAPNQQIVGHRDPGDNVFFVLSGQVKVMVYSLSGKAISFRTIADGGIFGEYAAIDGEPRSANVIAATEALVASMPAAVFRGVLTSHPEVALAMLKTLTEQLRALTERVVEFSTLAVKDRIRAEVLRSAREDIRDDNTAVISPPPTHAEIASRVSTHREAVTRELSVLTRAGILERRRDALIVRDLSRLMAMVQEALGQ